MATKSTALAKIEELQRQIEQLKQEAVEELKQKLYEARKHLVSLEEELAQLTGKPLGETKVRRIRRPAIADEELRGLLLKAMAAHGVTGLNARELADAIGQDAMRVRKFLNANPKALKRQGAGAGTKFFLP